ncbi:MAG TPA: ferrous iron transporter B [Candidatus Latescibacteria bacterium]|nr:ferrous iron transporter B [Candidatus Latescibacterota bacterium]
MSKTDAPPGGAAKSESAPARSLILIGNPNVGKSAIFGHLTGVYVVVSNYPGTTVEVTRGVAQSKEYEIYDTPGANGLVPMSEDELVTRSILLEQPDAPVVQVADMTNLRRALILTSQLSDWERTGALALNMADEAASRGIHVDLKSVEKLVGVPVRATVAVRRSGVREIAERSFEGRPFQLRIEFQEAIEKAISDITALLPKDMRGKRGVALTVLSGDETIFPWLKNQTSQEVVQRLEAIREHVRVQFPGGVAAVINTERLRRIDAIVAQVMRIRDTAGNHVLALVSSWATHPLKGLVVVGAVLYVTLWFVGLFGAGTLVDFFETFVFSQFVSPFFIRLADAILPFPHSHVIEPVNWTLSLPLSALHQVDLFTVARSVPSTTYAVTDGVSLTWWQTTARVVHDFFVGPYGMITMAFAYGFAIVLPIVATFFIIFGLLEDSGYLPRLAVMTNRLFRTIGLNGKAVLPMVLGFGCDTMATMTARILETKKERVITTLLLALGVPCSAQLGVILAMVATISLTGVLWWVITVAVVMMLVGWLAARVLPGDSSDLVLELPPMRVPQFGNIIVKTIARIEWYLKEVVPLFVLGTALLFFLDLFDALGAIRSFAAPVVQGWLGLPAQATEAFLIGFLRRDYGAAGLLQLQQHGLLDELQIVVSLVTITLFVPCVANVFMIAKERGIRTAIWMVVFIFPFAFLVGGLVRWGMILTGSG